jgi:hypothetical protein
MILFWYFFRLWFIMVFHSAFNSILFYWLSIRWYEMKLHSSNANFMQFLFELIFSGVGQRDKVQLSMSWSGAIPQSVGPVISTYKMASEPKFANVKEEYLNRGSNPLWCCCSGMRHCQTHHHPTGFVRRRHLWLTFYLRPKVWNLPPSVMGLWL